MTTGPAIDRRARGERGAALLELALVLPFLSLLAFGTVELGRAWVNQGRTTSAVAAAARVGAADGSRVQADRDILLALQVGLPSDLLAAADRVVVFRSDTADGAVPTGCIKAVGDPSEVGTSTCNTYTGATLRAVTSASMVGFGGTIGTKDVYWPPSSRKDTLSGPPDYLGIWVRTKTQSMTHVEMVSLTLTSRSVVRIQPDLNG